MHVKVILNWLALLHAKLYILIVSFYTHKNQTLMYSALGIDIEQAIAYCCINGYKVDIIWVCGPI